LGLLKKSGGRKKQVQTRGKTPRSQSLFFTAFALLVQLNGFFNTPNFSPNQFLQVMLSKTIPSFSDLRDKSLE